MKRIIKLISDILRKNPFVRDVLLFAFLIVGFHLFYRAWANWWHFWPIKDLIVLVRDWLADQVFVQSTWIDEHVLGLEILRTERDMIFPGHGYIGINLSCSGFKQIMQFIILMLFFPGPRKHKLWFIPLGILVVHLTNLFRIVGLSVVTINWPDYWQFSHDYLFRPFFYVMMFLMWVVWVEKIRSRVGSREQGVRSKEYRA